MIRVTLTYQAKFIVGMVVTGHADYAKSGEDLVCAGVSSIMFGLCNALTELVGIKNINITTNKVTIKISSPSKETNLIMQTGLIQLKTIKESFNKYIEIQEV